MGKENAGLRSHRKRIFYHFFRRNALLNFAATMRNWTDATLLLAAHGSASHPEAAEEVSRLAEALRRRGSFAEVTVGFWRQEPRLSADLMTGSRIFVLPYFSGLGKHTEILIPQRLGLAGKVTRKGGTRIHYCDPIGCHPGLPALIRRRSLEFCRAEGIDAQGSALLLVGHGSTAGHASRTPEAIAATLRELGGFSEVATAYLEQEPKAERWRDRVKSPDILVQPLLLSAGMHASADLPALFGGDKRVRLRPSVGTEAEIIAMILDQVAAAEREQQA